MGGLDVVGQPQVGLGADRHVDMAAFRGGDDAAPLGVMHRGRVEAGADVDDEHGGPRFLRALDEGAELVGVDMTQRIARRLEVVQDRDARSPVGRVRVPWSMVQSRLVSVAT